MEQRTGAHRGRKRASRRSSRASPVGLTGRFTWEMHGAGDRDRTGMTSLEGWGSTIELHPRDGVRDPPHPQGTEIGPVGRTGFLDGYPSGCRSACDVPVGAPKRDAGGSSDWHAAGPWATVTEQTVTEQTGCGAAW